MDRRFGIKRDWDSSTKTQCMAQCEREWIELHWNLDLEFGLVLNYDLFWRKKVELNIIRLLLSKQRIVGYLMGFLHFGFCTLSLLF